MQLQSAERSYLKLVRKPGGALNQESMMTFIDYFTQERSIRFRKPQHRAIFQRRHYNSLKELELALLRYKVFGDLGY